MWRRGQRLGPQIKEHPRLPGYHEKPGRAQDFSLTAPRRKQPSQHLDLKLHFESPEWWYSRFLLLKPLSLYSSPSKWIYLRNIICVLTISPGSHLHIEVWETPVKANIFTFVLGYKIRVGGRKEGGKEEGREKGGKQEDPKSTKEIRCITSNDVLREKVTFAVDYKPCYYVCRTIG